LSISLEILVGKVDVVEREDKNGEAFNLVNFSVASKDDKENKACHNYSAYEEKSDLSKDFKQRDFVKLFGQIRTSIDDSSKEYSNIRILSSKLLKAKEQMKGQDKKEDLFLELSRNIRRKISKSLKKRKKHQKKPRDKYMVVWS